VNGKRVHHHVLDTHMHGSVGCDVTIVDLTWAFLIEKV
jgi:hypothetical protein